jgi:hypothetical protein
MVLPRLPPPLTVRHGHFAIIINKPELLPQVLSQLQDATSVGDKVNDAWHFVEAAAQASALLARSSGRHFASLRDAIYHSKSWLSPRMHKKLLNLNTVASVVRHASPLFASDLLEQLAEEASHFYADAPHTTGKMQEHMPDVARQDAVLKDVSAANEEDGVEQFAVQPQASFSTVASQTLSCSPPTRSTGTVTSKLRHASEGTQSVGRCVLGTRVVVADSAYCKKRALSGVGTVVDEIFDDDGLFLGVRFDGAGDSIREVVAHRVRLTGAGLSTGYRETHPGKSTDDEQLDDDSSSSSCSTSSSSDAEVPQDVSHEGMFHGRVSGDATALGKRPK